MDLSSPARTVIPTLAAEVLLVLARTTMPLTGRQVHSLVHGQASQKGVWLVLDHLATNGLVDVTPAGPAKLYRLNRDHVGADAVLALVDLRGKLFQRIRDHLSSWRTLPMGAAVFGSAARGDGNPESDIDLFVIRPPRIDADDPSWAGDVSDLQTKVQRWSGNPCSIIQATPAQIHAMIERGEPIVASLREEAVTLFGYDILAMDTRRDDT